MRACGQTTDGFNNDQRKLYLELIREEMLELAAAHDAEDEVEMFDAVLDCIVVLIGFGLSYGWPMNEGWQEVMRSNLDKIDPVTGAVKRRHDGKILKPDGWTAPDLKQVLSKSSN